MSGPGQAAGVPGKGQISHGARFALLAIVALALMFVDHRQDHLAKVRELLSLAVHPIRVVVDLPFRTWNSVSQALTDNAELRRQRDELQYELLVAQIQLQEKAETDRENERLRELLNSIEEEQGFEVRVAEILSVDLENRQRFLINRGKQDGVFVEQVLLDADGIVGQIVAVSEFSSEAMLITDAQHAVPVTVERSRVKTIAEGMGDRGLLSLPFLPNTADIQPGDRLVTSGMGGVFPSGRPVAEVTEVELNPGQDFARVIARPLAALDRDQEVLLIWPSEEAVERTTAAGLTTPTVDPAAATEPEGSPQ
jgi:rod shape-determining protein MreC